MWEPRRIGGTGDRRRMGRGGNSKRWELGGIVRNYATMLNILQSKRSEKRKPRKKGWEPRLQGKWENPLSPHKSFLKLIW